MRTALERAGLDVERLDEQRRQSRARLAAALDRFRAGSDERAPALQHAVARSAEYWLEAHRVRNALAPATGYYAVSTADSISAAAPRPRPSCRDSRPMGEHGGGRVQRANKR